MHKKRSFLHQCLVDNSQQTTDGRGKNLIPPPERDSLWKAYLEKFKDYNRENDLYKFSKRNVHFSPFFAVRLPAWNII